MSVKINFVRGDEVLTTTMSVGRTMLDAAKKLNIPEIPAICNGSCNCGTCHVHIDPEWIERLNLWTLVLWNFLCLKDQKILMSLGVVYVVKWIFMTFMKV